MRVEDSDACLMTECMSDVVTTQSWIKLGSTNCGRIVHLIEMDEEGPAGKSIRTISVVKDEEACLDLTYTPIVFMIKPHTLKGAFIFGKSSGEKGCPQNASKLEILSNIGPTNATNFFNTNDNQLCPTDVLKLSPPPSTKYCNRKNHEDLTTIKDFNAAIKFDNMPDWFNLWVGRLEHFILAFSSQKVASLSLEKEIDIAVHRPYNDYSFDITINGVEWKLHHIPFIPNIDAKYDTTEQILFDIGLKRSCSLIRDIVNTFDDSIVYTHTYLSPNASCSTLLVGDCSVTPRMGIFISADNSDSLVRYILKVFIGENYFTFDPKVKDNGEFMILLNGKEKINIQNESYQFPVLEKFYDFRVEINEQNVLVIDNALMRTFIQFDMVNIINVEIFESFKDKMCGICSLPLNPLLNYSYC